MRENESVVIYGVAVRYNGGAKENYPYVSKSERLRSSDVWLKSPGTWGGYKKDIHDILVHF